MKYPIRSLALAAALTFVVGCDIGDYYPHHEAPLQKSDLQKNGNGTYGGNNSNYPVGTPGTTDAPMPATPPTVDASGATTSPAGGH